VDMKKLLANFRCEQYSRLKAVAASVIVASAFAFPGAQAQDTSDRLLGLLEPIQATKPLTFGVTVVHLMDNFYTGIAYGIMDEAKRSGVEVAQVSVAGGYGNVQEQFAQLQAFKSL